MAYIEIEDEILIPAKHAFEEYYNMKNLENRDFIRYLLKAERLNCEHGIRARKTSSELSSELDELKEKYREEGGDK